MTRTYQQARAGQLPDEPVVVVGQPTAIDPSRAPEGKHVLWLQARMAPDESCAAIPCQTRLAVIRLSAEAAQPLSAKLRRAEPGGAAR